MRRDYLIVFGLAVLFFFPFLGGVHLFDGYEINFAECAREMVLTGDWLRPQMNFQPFFEQPPLFYWAQALSMSLFGVNEFAARLPNAVCGVVTLLLVYRIGLRLHDQMFAWIWVLAWLGSFLPHFFFRSGIIDPWFNLLIFGGLYGFIEFRWQFLTAPRPSTYWQKYRWLVLGGFLLGMATMTKGPMAYLIVMLVLGLYWARYRFRGKGYLKHLIVFSASSMLVAGTWVGLDIVLHGTEYLSAFLAYQTSLFSMPDFGAWGVSALVLFIGCFPISVFALPNLLGDRQSEDELLESDTLAACERSDFGTWMQLLFWTALILFSLTQSKVAHYSSLCYFPLTYLGATTIWRAIRWEVRPMATTVLLPLVGVLVGLAAMSIPYFGNNHAPLEAFFANDAFALAALKAEVKWQIWEGLPGLILIVTSLVGWRFWRKNRPWLATQAVFGGGALFTTLAMFFILCNIEGHTQRAAIQFYQGVCDEDSTISPVGFNTRAHLFYACQQPGRKGLKTYFVGKEGRLDSLLTMPDCQEIKRKNGYVFFEQKRK